MFNFFKRMEDTNVDVAAGHVDEEVVVEAPIVAEDVVAADVVLADVPVPAVASAEAGDTDKGRVISQ